MKIAVIGAGNVGGTLGTRWAQTGHEVKFGVRDTQASGVTALLQRGGTNVSVGSNAEAVAFADVVVFALPYPALEGAVKEIGDFGDKILIDATNPITADFSGLACGGDSAAEEVALWSGSTRVVKCFNTVGFNVMADPKFDGLPATMLTCGDDALAKQTVAQLAADLGFAPVDAGPLSQAKWLESFAWLWISMAVKYGHGRGMAFLLHKRTIEEAN